jgi:hypothetical protein
MVRDEEHLDTVFGLPDTRPNTKFKKSGLKKHCLALDGTTSITSNPTVATDAKNN